MSGRSDRKNTTVIRCLWSGRLSSARPAARRFDLARFPGAAPSDSTTSCMKDADGDDYGDDTPPAGVTAGTDCDDDASAVSMGATEVCDGIDNDCDTDVDEGC
jgi:hypothetical protein